MKSPLHINMIHLLAEQSISQWIGQIIHLKVVDGVVPCPII